MIKTEDNALVLTHASTVLIMLHFAAFQVLLMKKDINPIELDFLLRFPSQQGVTSPVDFLNNNSWGGIKVCNLHEVF